MFRLQLQINRRACARPAGCSSCSALRGLRYVAENRLQRRSKRRVVFGRSQTRRLFITTARNRLTGLISSCPKDSIMKVIRPSFGYVKVQLQDGENGYVASEDIAPLRRSSSRKNSRRRPTPVAVMPGRPSRGAISDSTRMTRASSLRPSHCRSRPPPRRIAVERPALEDLVRARGVIAVSGVHRWDLLHVALCRQTGSVRNTARLHTAHDFVADSF